MTFLNPAVLFGLLAAGIPIVIHLLNLRKLKRIEFSTLAFLKELQKNQIRKVKLKQWLLLLLRVLIILLFVAAFARPTLRGIALGGAASAVKTTAVFILDDTYSMSVIDEHGSYFNQAKALAEKHLAALQPGDDAVIIPVSSAGREAVFTLTKNIRELSRQLKDAKVTEASGTLHEAVLRAAAVFGASQNYNKELYVFTDLQKNRVTRDSLHSNLSEFLSSRVNIYLFPFGGRDVYNMAVDSMVINSSILAAQRPVSLSVYTRNESTERSGTTVLSLFLNGERAAQKAVALRAGESAEVTLEATIRKNGINEMAAVIEDDDIETDNRYYAALNVPEKLPAILFEQSPGDGVFLSLALRSDDSLAVFALDIKPLSQFAGTNLEKYKLCILAGVAKNTAPDRARAFVSSGGGLFILPGASTSAADFSAFLSAFGIPPSVSLSERQNVSSGPVALFADPDFNHPLLRGIFVRRGKAAIESPELYKVFQLQTGGEARTIIGMNTRTPFLAESKINNGRLLFAASAFLPSWTNLPFKAFFVPLIYRSAFYLARADAAASSRTAGSALKLDTKATRGKLIKIAKPNGESETIQLKDGSETYRSTFSCGNYRIFSDGQIVDVAPVNHDPEESKTAAATAAEFGEYLKNVNAKAKLTVIDNREQSLDTVQRARFGAELWKWFAAMALLLALVEMWVARNSKKDIPDMGTGT